MKKKKTMRDALIERIYNRMHTDDSIFFLSSDFGAPKLDKLRNKFTDRFINVGIAEQNLINVSTGLALEGFAVYAYAIAAFLTMRAYEQIRNNISLHAKTNELNINLVGVGTGLSYDVAGPSHHCFEDISLMRTLPEIMIFSPSDWILTQKLVEYSINIKKPKYIRLDGKPLPTIYEHTDDIKLEKGFTEMKKGGEVCLISTGYMTHKALSVEKMLAEKNIDIGIIDIFRLKPLDEDLLFKNIRKYRNIITLEESFINKAGLDSLISSILDNKNSDIRLIRMGFGDKHVFSVGDRDYLHKINNLDEESIIKNINSMSN